MLGYLAKLLTPARRTAMVFPTATSTLLSRKFGHISISPFLRMNIKASPLGKCSHLLNSTRGMAWRRHKKLLKLAKGFRGRSNRCYRIAKQRVMKSMQYSYRDRKVRRRLHRKLWIMRINAATRIYGMTYNSFMSHLKHTNIELNRNVLANMAVNEPLSFMSIVQIAKARWVAEEDQKKVDRVVELQVHFSILISKFVAGPVLHYHYFSVSTKR